MRIFLSAIAILSLTACGGASTTSGTYSLPKGGSTVLSIPSHKPMMVTFGFELGSESWDATNECPERNVGDADDPFMMQICGGLYDANSDDPEWSAHFAGMHGGGITFHPKDGMIRVRLENHAHRAMDFQVEATVEDA